MLSIVDGRDTREEALSLNDELAKEADKLSRLTSKFGSSLSRKPAKVVMFSWPYSIPAIKSLLPECLLTQETAFL